MRVGLYGTMFLRVATALRDHSDLDVRLLLDDRGLALQTALRGEPALADRSLVQLEPFLSRRALLAPGRSALARRLSEFEVSVVSDVGPMFAQFTGRPWAFLPAGGDLTVTPFPIRARRLRDRWPSPGTVAIAGWQRRGIRRATEVWAQPFEPMRLAMRRLHLDPDLRPDDYLPVAIDVDLFAPPLDGAAAAARFPAVRAGADFVVLHPSRLMMDDAPFLRETGQWKRNEVVFDAFARLRAMRPGLRARLILVDQTYSPGRDRARQLCQETGIADAVTWMGPGRAEGFSWFEMRDLYALADVVLDDFGVGWFGSVVLEALATGRPMVTYVREDVMTQLYPWHPIRSAATAPEVAAELAALADHPGNAARLGARGREWIEQFHGPRAIAARYDTAIRRVAAARQRRPNRRSD